MKKRYFTAADRDGSRFGDWKGLRTWAQKEGLCFIIVEFKFVFQHPGLDVWQTGFRRRYCRLNVRLRDRNLELSIVRDRLRLNRVTLKSSQKEVLCRGWRELSPPQNPVAHHRTGLRLVRCGHRRWLTVFYLPWYSSHVEINSYTLSIFSTFCSFLKDTQIAPAQQPQRQCCVAVLS